MFKYDCKYCFTSQPDLCRAIAQLLDGVEHHPVAGRHLVRLVFFGSVSDNNDYLAQLQTLSCEMTKRWGNSAPIHSYVVQPVQGRNTMAVEAHYITADDLNTIDYRNERNTRYSVINTSGFRLLLLGGVLPSHLSDPISRQSDEVFATVAAILNRENVPIHRIIRQWNYIEQITRMENSVQRYQAFNDARTLFYQKDSWQPEGYPAATGIGTQWGGVMIDLLAAVSIDSTNTVVVPVDNPLQVAAHDYSQQVLLGERNEQLHLRSTPKFERAKVIGDSRGNGVCFVSGTAAIRGEASVIENNIDRQVEITLENVAHLISRPNLLRSGFNTNHPQQLSHLRVYLKQSDHFEEARDAVNRHLLCPQQLYVVADVCRDELLVEVEGVAFSTP